MSVSVLIKTLNEAENIAATIESVLEAIGPDDEVIIADSGSRDGTVEIAARYPVKVVQIGPGAVPSCGLGPQLGFQYSKGRYLCLMDGDMRLDPEFLGTAKAFLESHPQAAGVAGRVEEMNLDNLEFARRKSRDHQDYHAGAVDRLSGGGLYRRSAIEAVGHLSDRNLHGYEEFELAVRLRSQGFTLYRLDIPFVQHFGYRMNAYALLLRRWQSKYLRGIGEVLRAAWGKPHWFQVVREIRELKLWAAVYAGLAGLVLTMVFVPDKLLALGLCLVAIAAAIGVMSFKHRSLSLGVYAVTVWVFVAAALPLGFFAPRRDPGEWIESRVVHEPSVSPHLETEQSLP